MSQPIPNVSKQQCEYRSDKWNLLVEAGWVTMTVHKSGDKTVANMLYCPQPKTQP